MCSSDLPAVPIKYYFEVRDFVDCRQCNATAMQSLVMSWTHPLATPPRSVWDVLNVERRVPPITTAQLTRSFVYVCFRVANGTVHAKVAYPFAISLSLQQSSIVTQSCQFQSLGHSETSFL